MKKAIVLIMDGIMVLTLLLTGCNRANNYIPQNAKEIGYFYYPGTDWGMTMDEMCAAMSKKPSDFTIRREEGEYLTTTYLTDTTEFLNEKCPTVFEFVSVPNSEVSVLSTVTISYPMDEKDFPKLCVDIEAMIKQQDIPVSTSIDKQKNLKSVEDQGNVIKESDPAYDTADASLELTIYKITSKADMTNLPQEIKDGYNEYIQDLIRKGYLESIPEETDYTQTLKEPLSRLVIRFIDNFEDGSKNCQIVFSGRGISEPVGYLKAVS